jgi:hypothetical protein
MLTLSHPWGIIGYTVGSDLEEVAAMGRVQVQKINNKESWRVFDAAAKRVLRISGEEFARRWDEGVYKGNDSLDVMKVAMLRPSGR